MLESAMGCLTLQDSVQQLALDRADKDSKTQAPQVSDSCVKDGACTEGNGSVHHSDSSSKPAEASDKITGSGSDHSEMSKKPEQSDLRQQPRESNPAYLMRLLDKRKGLFSKIADIQTYPTCTSQSSQLNPVSADGEKRADSEVNIAAHSDRGQRGSEQNLHGGAVSGEQTTADLQSTKGQDIVESTSDTRTFSKHSQSATKPSIKGDSASPQPQLSPLNSVCQIISQWITPETFNYLGLNSAQAQGDDAGQGHSTDAFHKDPEMQKKYRDLCQRLASQEKDFEDILGEEDLEEEERREWKKPLPHFSELKKQTEGYRARVEEFLSGPSGKRKKSKKVGMERIIHKHSHFSSSVILQIVHNVFIGVVVHLLLISA